MDDQRDRTGRREGTLLLADISGYTNFIQGISDAHRAIIVDADEPPKGYTLISSLLDAMAEQVASRFRPVKLEGDALFAVSAGDTPARGEEVVDCLRSCHDTFRRLLDHAGEAWTCQCGACSLIRDLDLKFVIHHGEYVVQRIVGSEELAGPDVIVVHRLLKNHARDLVGSRPYALFSDAAVRALDVPTEGMLAAVETYEGLPPVPVRVLPLA